MSTCELSKLGLDATKKNSEREFFFEVFSSSLVRVLWVRLKRNKPGNRVIVSSMGSTYPKISQLKRELYPRKCFLNNRKRNLCRDHIRYGLLLLTLTSLKSVKTWTCSRQSSFVRSTNCLTRGTEVVYGPNFYYTEVTMYSSNCSRLYSFTQILSRSKFSLNMASRRCRTRFHILLFFDRNQL